MEKFNITAKIEFNLTAQDIEDIVVTALNGGIGYWACLDNSRPEYASMGKEDCVDAWTAKILLDGGTVYLIDEEERDEVYELTLDKLLSGVRQYVEKGCDRYGVFNSAEIDWSSFDAEAADEVIQLGIFNDIVFG